MFFDPKDGMRPPPFKHTVYNALVIPRPIGWISTISSEGVINLAPFSFFNSLCGEPPCVMYCPNGFKTGTGELKDSLTNVTATGEFVFNMCTQDLLEQMNATSAHVPASVDEMAEAGLAAAPCEKVKPPRVKASPIALECTHLQTIDLPATRDDNPNTMVIGQVVGIHIADEVISDGMVDMAKLRPLARLGYLDYAVINPENIFSVKRPD
ncbi:MAG: flavin reductase family protein [Alphaproteobacteria bacterium]|jgi:flavin reductase (DIM6/NTAB) family NADH-FMN oxidoreductase RutF|nr:flavin reductase family protein [Alphaproteobacteria bacterium]MDP6564550.1 flavin reductase family protein [Alphaproteobacteria bacterium]MDP6811908.1 flavin reductase family protein [Alphaproteobacteria bacterium]